MDALALHGFIIRLKRCPYLQCYSSEMTVPPVRPSVAGRRPLQPRRRVNGALPWKVGRERRNCAWKGIRWSRSATLLSCSVSSCKLQAGEQVKLIFCTVLLDEKVRARLTLHFSIVSISLIASTHFAARLLTYRRS